MTYDNPIGKYIITVFFIILMLKYAYVIFMALQSMVESAEYAYANAESRQESQSRHYSSYKEQSLYKRDEVKREIKQLRIPGRMSRFANELNFFKNCQDPYEVLNCSSYATKSIIKKSYRQLALKWHPDSITGRGATQEEIAQATQILQIINVAYPEALRKAS